MLAFALVGAQLDVTEDNVQEFEHWEGRGVGFEEVIGASEAGHDDLDHTELVVTRATICWHAFEDFFDGLIDLGEELQAVLPVNRILQPKDQLWKQEIHL